MTKLLVSVRDANEAQAALQAGADLIDIKEPNRGSLGAADLATVEQIVATVAGQVPISVALGELSETPTNSSIISWRNIPNGVQFAKCGLAGCQNDPRWPLSWTKATKSLAENVAHVAVVYADWKTAGAPSPDDVVAAAQENRAAAVLIDTFDKSGGDLLHHWPSEQLAYFTRRLPQNGLLLVLAGSLTLRTIRSVLPLDPDYVAVRGAVCAGDRTDRIDGSRVATLVSLLAEYSPGEAKSAPGIPIGREG
jgi:uncharacterized protein (UPF0264 family)